MLQLMKTAPVSDMNRRAKEVLAMLENGPVALLQRSEPVAVMVQPTEWNKLLQELEDLQDVVAAYRAEIELDSDDDFEMIDTEQLQAELDNAKIPA